MNQNCGSCAEGSSGSGAKVLVGMGEDSGEERRVVGLGFRARQGMVRSWVGLHRKETGRKVS